MQYSKKVFFLYLFKNAFYKKKETIEKLAKTTLAMPLVVKNAKFTFDKSFGFTKVC